VNSEELEVSLRTEFEHYLSGVRAEMKQKLADFQQKVEGEFEKHKSQIDEAIHDFSRHVESESAIDEILKESVVEHLRLARDDGARLAASASAEAERLGLDAPTGGAGFDLIRDAILEISSKTSQSAILKTLIEYSSKFTSRGAFFIIKNEQFIGWQVFGNHGFMDGDVVREIKFAVSADTILGDSVKELATTRATDGAHSEDRKFLDVLKFGRPSNMVAVPLIARGRGVAVLYADQGEDDGILNVDALETLVRVAGLTVELLASSQFVPQPEPRHGAVMRQAEIATPQTEAPSFEPETTESSVEQQLSEPIPAEVPVEASAVPEVSQPDAESVAGEVIPVEIENTLDDEAYLMTEPVEEVMVAGEVEEVPASIEVETTTTEFAFASEDNDPSIQHVDVEYTNGSADAKGNGHTNGKRELIDTPAEVATVAAEPQAARRTGRRMDLPIEVAEDERRLHTDARRFARLLVSEIKLYNEQQVNEGRQTKDLYDRLRDSIERSREMYNKRVKPPVAEKFDYFHYELVSGLAEGEEARLGSNYPGSAA
jgi:hypothetical protein